MFHQNIVSIRILRGYYYPMSYQEQFRQYPFKKNYVQ
jgi:hypothetical protein